MDDRRALFWKLLEPEHLKARAFCRKLMADRDDGDDLYQDCLVRALTGFEKLKNRDVFRPWLYKIMINRFKSRYRRERLKSWLWMTENGHKVDAAADAENAHAAKRRIRIALMALAPYDRALVTLYELQGWPLGELSAVTGKSEGSLKVRLSRARAVMRRALIRYLTGASGDGRNRAIKSEEKICVVTKPGRK